MATESDLMKLILFLAVGSLCMVSCKEAQEMANKAKEAVVETVEEVKEDLADSVPQAADATMQSLVDQNSDGYRFRKDLPFRKRSITTALDKITPVDYDGASRILSALFLE